MSDDVNQLISQFEEFFQVFNIVEPYLSLDNTEKKFFTEKKLWIDRLKQPEFPVAFFGVGSAGKSTVINGLIGEDILPTDTKATTAFPTIIKKGTTDKITIYYLSDEEKYQLRGEIIKKIGQHIEQNNLSIEPNLNEKSIIQELRRKIEEYNKKSGKQVGHDELKKLESLFCYWNNKSTKEIQKHEIKNYREGLEETIVIKKIEATIQNIEIPDDIILVDLPGLSVNIDRHISFTEYYVKNHAKAFVVCAPHLASLEREDITLLVNLHRSNPSILERSFWLLTQIDTASEDQKKRAFASLKNIIFKNNFQVNDDRIYKVAALVYSIVSHHRHNKLEKNKEAFENADVAKIEGGVKQNFNEKSLEELISKYEELSEFDKFKKDLTFYLKNSAKKEFINSAKYDLLKISENLSNLLEPLAPIQMEEEDHQIIFSQQVSKTLNAFLENLKNKVEIATNKLLEKEKINFWSNDYEDKIKSIIESTLKSNQSEIFSALKKGKDVSLNISRLPFIVDERIEKNLNFRLLILESVKPLFIDEFLYDLYISLINHQEYKNIYIPNKVKAELRDKLSDRDIKMRLFGVSDCILHSFMRKVDEIGLSLKEIYATPATPATPATYEYNPQKALEKYQNELSNYIPHLSNEINNNIWRAVINHTKYIQEDLLKFFIEESNSIHNAIATNIELDESYQKNRAQLKDIRDSIKILNKIKS